MHSLALLQVMSAVIPFLPFINVINLLKCWGGGSSACWDWAEKQRVLGSAYIVNQLMDQYC